MLNGYNDDRQEDDVANTNAVQYRQFGVSTPDRNIAMVDTIDKTNKFLVTAAHELKTLDDTYYVDPNTGSTITNSDPNKVWFANNICVIVSTGMVFDSNDMFLLGNISTYFDKTQDTYLGCLYEHGSYTDDFIQRLERTQNIDNGNYHIACFVVCYAKQEELDLAPEQMFRIRGICRYFVDIDNIVEEMTTYMQKYGFTKKSYATKTYMDRYTDQQPNYSPENRINYNDNIDWDSEVNRQLYSDLKNRDEMTEFGKRARIKQESRNGVCVNKPPRNSVQLESRIKTNHEDFIPQTPQPDKLGVVVQLDENMQLRNNTIRNDNYELYNLGRDNDLNPYRTNSINHYTTEEVTNTFAMRDSIQMPTIRQTPKSTGRTPNGFYKLG